MTTSFFRMWPAPLSHFLCVASRCIFPSLRPWLNGCAAGSPFGSRMVTTSRNLIATFRVARLHKLEKFGWWMSPPTGTLASRCCVSFHFSLFLLAFLVTVFQFFRLPQKIFFKKIHQKIKKSEENTNSETNRKNQKEKKQKRGLQGGYSVLLAETGQKIDLFRPTCHKKLCSI